MYSPITYLDAFVRKNVLGFKMGIIIYTEVGLRIHNAKMHRYITFEKHLCRAIELNFTYISYK